MVAPACKPSTREAKLEGSLSLRPTQATQRDPALKTPRHYLKTVFSTM
jgi:hypothetical protein